ncbi:MULTISPECIES: DUF3060 domain-containing protein [unclassified Curtobacterium]|uniref:DUF3060 domain-containing protein n=1 Tax=unclassified Curtobacterium TaxID=257496 RepID=UPI000F47F30D|nr:MULTISPECIES: DUF3060 domain-containing protein [unclassified Curtobacterium]ROQ17729.1 DUF3060 family protein [Curtobacterium sp. PhB171]ROQ29026.1 DUF3060 family protein [Curtobacterium sp. PhB170]ROS45830.1 DUF3060 family protein [Curtobacterium sp. PhB131]ROS67868.1 DUF3060 family protein [Curtobacterium sp. PhB141]
MRTSSRMPRVIASALAAVGILSAVTACSGTGDDKPKPTPTSSASAKVDLEKGFSTPPADIEKAQAECVDGKVVIDQSNKEVTVGDCASVEITASNAVIHLGNVEKLVMTGTINDVAAKKVGSVQVTGNANRVTTDGKPKISDKGTDNLFVTR